MATNPSEDGEERAWKQAFARHSEPHWDALLRFATSLCHARADAEDIVQTSLLRGIKYFKAFAIKHLKVQSPSEVDAILRDPPKARHFRNWLYQIVRHVFYDERELSGRMPLLDEDLGWNNSASGAEGVVSSDFGLENGPDSGVVPEFSGKETVDPDELAEREERFYTLAADDDLKNRLAELTDRQRSVIYLVSEDYSYKEVAKILGIPIGTVMSTLSRALVKLGVKRSSG